MVKVVDKIHVVFDQIVTKVQAVTQVLSIIVQLEINLVENVMKNLDIQVEPASNSITVSQTDPLDDDCTLEAAALSLVNYYAKAGIALSVECVGIVPCASVGLCPPTSSGASRRHRRTAAQTIRLQTSGGGDVTAPVTPATIADLSSAAADAGITFNVAELGLASALEYLGATGSPGLTTTQPGTLEYFPAVPEFTFFFPIGVLVVGLATEIFYRAKGSSVDGGIAMFM